VVHSAPSAVLASDHTVLERYLGIAGRNPDAGRR
jgi:hypothetical protein